MTSQKDLMAAALQGQADGWAGNLKNRFAKALMRCGSLPPSLRREALWINAMRAWTLPCHKQRALLAAQPKKPGSLASLSPQASRMMRKMARAYVAKHRLPNPLGLPLQVNQLCSVWAGPSKSKSWWAGSWLRISTLERGGRIELPLMGNAWADARGGERAATFALAKRGGEWFATSTQYIQPTPWAAHGVETLGIDLGMRTLVATSEGDLLGTGFLERLKRYDRELQRVQKGLQAAGVKRLSACRRYRRLVQRIRGWIKTRVQTCVGRALAIHRPERVAAEDLSFAGRSGDLSRRMNRLVRGFGQAVFKQTLLENSEEFGFALDWVDPAYSSQECHRCRFVLRSNRVGEKFKCKSCGHSAHADVNAAKNLAGRSGRALGEKAWADGAGGSRARWERALRGWLSSAGSRLAKRPDPDSPGFCRAAGSARMGLLALALAEGEAERLGPKRRGAMLLAAASRTSGALFKGLSLCGP